MGLYSRIYQVVLKFVQVTGLYKYGCKEFAYGFFVVTVLLSLAHTLIKDSLVTFYPLHLMYVAAIFLSFGVSEIMGVIMLFRRNQRLHGIIIHLLLFTFLAIIFLLRVFLGD